MQSHIMRWVVPIIAGLIVVGIFLFWVMGQMQDLPITHMDTSEENRFIRYISCAVAMCGGLHQTESNDICLSADVMSQPLEYDGQDVVKGCRELCEEIRDNRSLPVQDRYCGDSVKFDFTFQEPVIYTANRSTGSNDLRRVHKWKGVFIQRGRCFDYCGRRAGGYMGGDEGWLHDYEVIYDNPDQDMCLDPSISDFGIYLGCNGYADSGSIWIKHDTDPTFVTNNCDISGYVDYEDRTGIPIIDECTIPAGIQVEIWTENIQDGLFACLYVFDICLIPSCDRPWGTYYACPQVVVSVI